MIRVGIVGLGFMGWIHWLAYERLRGVRVSAVCDPKPKRLAGDFRGVRGNFGPPGKKVALKGAAKYLDWQELLHDPAVDLVDITLPTALHAEVAVAALNAGKHVLCEKPMSLSSRECGRMIRAAERAKRMLLIAHVLPFFPEYAWALKVVQSGKYGSVQYAKFCRIIGEPTWMQGYWSPQVIGGPMFDLHVHDAHFIRLLFGPPKSAQARGSLRNGLPEYWTCDLRFSKSGPIVYGECGVRNELNSSFTHGFDICLEKASLAFNFSVSGVKGHYWEEPTINDHFGRARHPKLQQGEPLDAFIAELREAVRCVRNHQSSEFLSPEVALDAIRICEAEAKSLISLRAVRL
jgi:predicted dehydrogenase